MSLLRSLVFSLLLCTHFGIVFSQSLSCEEMLANANAEFDAGRFYGLSNLLSKCLENGFTKEQKFRAYYLLVQAYLILDDPLAAESAYLNLLKIDPEFRASTAKDPVDLYLLSKKFTSRPRFTPHYGAGVNASFPSSLAAVSTYSNDPSISNGIRIGYQVGAGIDFNINDRWSIGAEGMFSNKRFSTQATGMFVDDDLIVNQSFSFVDIPVFVKYQDDSGRFRPFGYAGFAWNLLFASSASLVYNDRSPFAGINVVKVAQGPDVDFNYSRFLLNRSVVVGGGMKYKISKNFVYVDLRYTVGLNNLVNTSRNFYNSDGTLSTSVTQYAFVNDLFLLDNLSMSVGYVMPIYQPRKVKKISSKGFLSNLGLFGKKRKTK